MYVSKEKSRIKILVNLSSEEGAAIRGYVKVRGSGSKYNLKQLSKDLHIDSGQFTRIIQGKCAITQEKLETLYLLLKSPSELSFIERYRVKSVGDSSINKKSAPSDYLYDSTKRRLDERYEKAQLPERLEILSRLEEILQNPNKRCESPEKNKRAEGAENG